MTAGFLIEFEPAICALEEWTELVEFEFPVKVSVTPDRFPEEPEIADELWAGPEMVELWPEIPWIEDGVDGGIMAVIIETEEGEAISEATGVTESEPGLLSRPPVVEAERELATLRLIE